MKKILVLLILSLMIGCSSTETLAIPAKGATTAEFNDYTKKAATEIYDKILHVVVMIPALTMKTNRDDATKVKDNIDNSTEGLAITNKYLKEINKITPTPDNKQRYEDFKTLLQQSTICFTNDIEFAKTKDQSKYEAATSAISKALPYADSLMK